MYFVKIINSENCVLESREVKDFSNNSVKKVFEEYENPASVHIDIEDVFGKPVSYFRWSDFKKSMKYRGIVSDKMGTMDTRKTIWRSTYKEAHDAAEKLAERTMGARAEIEVEED